MGSKGSIESKIPQEADDTLVSRAYARVIDLLGEGPFSGFADATGRLLQDAEVVEQPQISLSGGLFYDAATHTIDPADNSVANTVTEDSSGYLVAGNSGVNPAVAGQVDCTVLGDGEGAEVVAIIYPLNDQEEGSVKGLRVTQAGTGYTWVRILVPPATGTAIFLDNVPIVDASTFRPNFPNVQVHYRSGLPHSDPIPGFPGAEETVVLDMFPITHLAPTTTTELAGIDRTIEFTGDYDSVILNLGLDEGFYVIDRKLGNVMPVDIPVHIQLEVSYKDASNAVYSPPKPLGDGDYKITGKTRSAYTYTIKAKLPRPPDAISVSWRITARRITPNDADDDSVYDRERYTSNSKVGLGSMVKVTEQRLRYPNSALVGLKVDAEDFARVPTRSYRMRMAKIQVPTNYFSPHSKRTDGTFRKFGEYTRSRTTGKEVVSETGQPIEQEWDGSFYAAWTNNPAWVFYAVCTHNRYGMGDLLPGADKWVLYKIARYCDELVPTKYSSGVRLFEPRFTCNTYIQAKNEAWRSLVDFASVFRGMLYWAYGRVMASFDHAQKPIAQFTKSNVTTEGFSYTGTARSARRTVIVVKWNDPEQHYKQVPLVVQDPVGVVRYGYRDKTIIAFGCTSKGQARRVGRAVLLNELNNTDIIKFNTGTEGATLRPGDVIEVMDPSHSQVNFGGRIADLEQMDTGEAVITLDRELDPTILASTAPTEFFIRFVRATELTDTEEITSSTELAKLINSQMTEKGEGHIKAFSKGADGKTQVTLFQGIPEGVILNGVWTVQSTDLVARQFKVLRVMERDTGVYEVSALEYHYSLFDSIDKDAQFIEEETVALSDTWLVPQVPRNLKLHSFSKIVEDKRIWTINVSWTAPLEGYVQEYRVNWRRGKGNYTTFTVTPTTSVDVVVPEADTYCFRITAIGIGGRTGPGAELCETLVDLDIGNNEIISGLELLNQGNDTDFYAAEVALNWRVNWSKATTALQTVVPPVRPPNIQHYRLNIYDVNYLLLDSRSVTETQFTLTLDANRGLQGGPYRELIFEVSAITYDGTESSSRTIRVRNQLPTAPTSVTATLNSVNQIVVDVRAAKDLDFEEFTIWMSTTSGFTPDDSTRVYRGASSTIIVPVPSAGTYYLKVGVADSFSSGDPAQMTVSNEIAVS